MRAVVGDNAFNRRFVRVALVACGADVIVETHTAAEPRRPERHGHRDPESGRSPLVPLRAAAEEMS